MLTFLNSRFRLHRLRSQLILTFLVGFLGIAVAIGLPVIVLINRQASSQAQLLLDQSVVAARAFIGSEQSNLQSLAILVSQRPTLMRLLKEQSFPSLGEYLNTLRVGANLDFVLVCSNGRDITGLEQNVSIASLCLEESPSGYAVVDDDEHLYMYSWVDLKLPEGAAYKVIAGKKTSAILAQLQNETGLRYFLVQQNQIIHSSDSTIKVSSALIDNMLA